MHIPRENTTPYPFFRAMAIFLSLAIVLSANFSAEELIEHKHIYVVEEIREPDKDANGEIRLVCSECGHHQTYSLSSLSDPEPLDAETTKSILRFFFSSLEPSYDEQTPYSEHAVRNVILSLFVLILILFLFLRWRR